jgi:uncharacterized membrane protein YqiK
MTSKPSTLLLVFATAATLMACEKSTKDAQADAIRDTSAAAGSDMDDRADAVEEQGKAMGEAAENRAEAGAEAIRENADAVRARGEQQADAVDAGTRGATTSTDRLTTTTTPDPK